MIERDIDGDRAETTELENREPRFGQVNAARRVARTVFLASAPSPPLPDERHDCGDSNGKWPRGRRGDSALRP